MLESGLTGSKVALFLPHCVTSQNSVAPQVVKPHLPPKAESDRQGHCRTGFTHARKWKDGWWSPVLPRDRPGSDSFDCPNPGKVTDYCGDKTQGLPCCTTEAKLKIMHAADCKLPMNAHTLQERRAAFCLHCNVVAAVKMTKLNNVITAVNLPQIT